MLIQNTKDEFNSTKLCSCGGTPIIESTPTREVKIVCKNCNKTIIKSNLNEAISQWNSSGSILLNESNNILLAD